MNEKKIEIKLMGFFNFLKGFSSLYNFFNLKSATIKSRDDILKTISDGFN